MSHLSPLRLTIAILLLVFLSAPAAIGSAAPKKDFDEEPISTTIETITGARLDLIYAGQAAYRVTPQTVILSSEGRYVSPHLLQYPVKARLKFKNEPEEGKPPILLEFRILQEQPE